MQDYLPRLFAKTKVLQKLPPFQFHPLSSCSFWCRDDHLRGAVGASLCRCLPQSKPLPVMFVPFFQVYALLDTLVTDLMVLADELSPIKNVEEPLRLCT